MKIGYLGEPRKTKPIRPNSVGANDGFVIPVKGPVAKLEPCAILYKETTVMINDIRSKFTMQG
ncbi:MAG: hypothetical protein ACYSYV_04510, partial [Planctomycetota bacterium]